MEQRIVKITIVTQQGVDIFEVGQKRYSCGKEKLIASIKDEVSFENNNPNNIRHTYIIYDPNSNYIAKISEKCPLVIEYD